MGTVVFMGISLNQLSGANFKKKKHFLEKFCIKFLAFSSFFRGFFAKNVQKAYFNQCLECPAPKCRSKYTTPAYDLQFVTFGLFAIDQI